MNRRQWTYGFASIAVFIFAVSTGVLAAQGASQQGRIETFGVISNMDPQAGTLTITVNRTNENLQDKFGENVTFHTGSAAQVGACATELHQMTSCWDQLTEIPNKYAREAERGDLRTKLNQFKDGDWVFISGHFDENSDQFMADEILKWQ